MGKFTLGLQFVLLSNHQDEIKSLVSLLGESPPRDSIERLYKKSLTLKRFVEDYLHPDMERQLRESTLLIRDHELALNFSAEVQSPNQLTEDYFRAIVGLSTYFKTLMEVLQTDRRKIGADVAVSISFLADRQEYDDYYIFNPLNSEEKWFSSGSSNFALDWNKIIRCLVNHGEYKGMELRKVKEQLFPTLKSTLYSCSLGIWEGTDVSGFRWNVLQEEQK